MSGLARRLLIAGATLPLSLVLADGIAHAQNCTGGPEVNVIICSNNNDFIDLDGGNDQADALSGDDEIHMGSGDDIAWGRGGLDIMFGGTSSTTAWADELYGGTGADTIKDTETGDTDGLCGNAGNDIINTQDGDNNDFVAGGPDSDTISADGGDNVNQGDPTCPP